MNRVFLLIIFTSATTIPSFAQKLFKVESPDKSISLSFTLAQDGSPTYSVSKDGIKVLEDSRLGIVREDGSFNKNFSLTSASLQTSVADHYELLTGKRKTNKYEASQRILHLKNSSGELFDIIFQVSNDGVAFRYYFPGASNAVKKILEESTSFNFPAETKAWLQPMSVAKTGWESTNPSYEENYQKGISVGTSAPTEAGWVYPALFNYKDKWVLISETSLDRNYCGTRLKQASPDGEFSVGFPGSKEVFPGGNSAPQSVLPWYTPWRIIVIGSLKTIVESTLGTDLAKNAITVDKSNIKPGISSWSWVLLKDDSTVYAVQKKFVDYAADMNWEYCLIDAEWDQKIGYEKMQELVDYAKQKNIGIILWYNSAGSWNTVKYTPKDKLVTRESRMQEFTLLQKMGVKGMKIDFFGGDGQSMINYYIDIMEDAAKFGLLINFHGATLPRGWHRTYPNLMTMESIKGMEFITFGQDNANEAPAHATTIPFTRNVFDPMDFTPMALYKIPGIERRTTSAFELATSVIFLSGIQHMAETPRGMQHMPAFVKDFLRTLPGNWDDVKFIDGYPGKLAVIARKSGDRWIIAGINGEATPKDLSLDLSFIKSKNGFIITDDGNGSLTQAEMRPDQATRVKVLSNGGFVIVF
jgi:hypothetical protein